MLIVVMMLVLVGYYYMSHDIILGDEVVLNKILNTTYRTISKIGYLLIKVLLFLSVYLIPLVILILILSPKRGERIRNINQGIESLAVFLSGAIAVVIIASFQLAMLLLIPEYYLKQNLNEINLLMYLIYAIQILTATIHLANHLFVFKQQQYSLKNEQKFNRELFRSIVINPLVLFVCIYLFSFVAKVFGIELSASGTESVNYWLFNVVGFATIIAIPIYYWLSILKPIDYLPATHKQQYSKKRFVVLNVVVLGLLTFVMMFTFVTVEQINILLFSLGLLLLLCWSVVNGLAIYSSPKFKLASRVVLGLVILLLATSHLRLHPQTFVPYSSARQVEVEAEPISLEQAVDLGLLETSTAISVECETEEQITLFLDSLRSGQLDQVEYLSIYWKPKNNVDVSKYPEVQMIDLSSLENLRHLEVDTLLPSIPISLDVTGLSNLEYIGFDITLDSDDQQLLDIIGMETLNQLKYLYIGDADLSQFQIPFVENDYCYVVDNVEECGLGTEPSTYQYKYLRNDHFAEGEMVPSLRQVEVAGWLDEENFNQYYLDIVKEYSIPIDFDARGTIKRWDNQKQSWQEVA